MNPYLLRLSCLLFIFSGLFAADSLATDSNSKMQLALKKLYHFRFLDADSIIAKFESQNADDYIPAMARASFHWWSIISHEENAQIQAAYITNLLHAEQLINASSPDQLTDEQLFFLIHVHAYQLRLELMQGEYFRAYRNLNQSMRHIGASLGREASFPPFLLTSGLYNYMTDYIRKTQPLFRFYLLLHPRGSMYKGIEQLKTASRQQDILIKTEATYFLMRIFLDLENDPATALKHAEWLTDQYPENLIYIYYHHQIASKLSLTDLASSLKNQYYEALNDNTQLTGEQKTYFDALPGL